MLTIDGSMGEGGGQILRSCLALSMCYGTPLRITNIRSARRKPGLMRQHLAAVNAAAVVSDATVEGAALGSGEIGFTPRRIKAGRYQFATGTAGSATLVLQTVLPALLTADGPSHLLLEGGTHNPMAPPFDFIDLAFIPVINRLGPNVIARLERAGFYPRGGGRFHVDIEPTAGLKPLQLTQRGEILELRARATVANLPRHIARRELKVVERELGLSAEATELYDAGSVPGPGNVLTVIVRSRHITEVFTGFGERGLRAESVAEKLVQRVRRYLAAGVPVGEHLADQLMLPAGLAGSSAYVSLRPTPHTTTNIAVMEQFMKTHIDCEPLNEDVWCISVH